MVEEKEEEEEESHGQNLTECLNYPLLNLVSNGSHSSDHHDRHSVVFPPVNHEGLPISTTSDHDTNNKQHNRPPLSISLDRVLTHVPLLLPLPAVTSGSERCGWGRKFICLLGCKMIRTALSIRKSFTPRVRMLLRFNFPASVTAALLVVIVLVFRSRLHRRREESRDNLIRLIKDKDEKINQLLGQIAQMNEILLPKLFS